VQFLSLDPFVLLTTPRFTLRQRIAQAYFQGSMLDQFTLVAIGGTVRRTQKNRSVGRLPTAGAANLLLNYRFTHLTGCA
jgi:hypothetical protein